MAEDDDLRRTVAERVNKLRSLDHAGVQSLPSLVREVLLEGKIRIAQYHDVLSSGEHMVVVQALRDRLLGLSTAIEIDGFVVSNDGSRRALSDEETWPFL